MTTRRLAAALLLLALLSAGAEAAVPKRVLIIHSFGRDLAPYNTIGPTLRTDLALLLRQPVAFTDISLDAERGEMPDERPLVEYLRHRHRDMPPDLVVAIANPAMLFWLRHRDQLFPDRPLLITGIDRRRLDSVKLGARDRAVSVTLDFPAVARTILELRPDTTTIALGLGTSPLEQFWVKAMQRELAPLGDHVRVLAPDGLSLDQMRERAATLPPNSAVIYFIFAVGADGVEHENDRALAAIWESSSAPVFGLFTDQLGKGIVGGSLFDMREFGSTAAKLAVGMLAGDVAGGNVDLPPKAPAFDWRELQRWGIPESRLPPGAEVHFRPPSLLEQHKVLILAAIAIVLVQAALINALLLQRRRLRRTEKEAAGLSGRLITAHEDERKRLARELHDDLTQRLARLAIDAGRMENAPTAPAGMRPLREDLVRLSEDVHALSYRLHPSVLDDLGLIEALKAECERVARSGALRVDVDANGGVPEALTAEASLCLFRVLQEALSNAARHARASAVTVLLAPSGKGLQLAVSDNGSGFDQGQPRAHTSLGLASMRERVRLLQGHFAIASTPGRGTTVVAWVPA
jgi:signal transduction histidine kinase